MDWLVTYYGIRRNEGIVSTSSLMKGIATANTGRTESLLATIAEPVTGAMSMAPEDLSRRSF